MTSNFQLLKRIYNIFDPSVPLQPHDPAYVNCNDVRGDGDILVEIGKEILYSDRHNCQLYAGHRGAGKSTELLRLQKFLDEHGFFVVYFAADEQDIHPQDTEYTDILLACTRHILEAFKDRTNPKPLWDWLKKLGQELKDIVPEFSLENISIEKDIPSFAKITASLRANPSNRRRIRNLINPHTQTLLEALNEFIYQAKKELPLGKSEIVVIVDNLDRIAPILYEDGRSNYEHIFIDRCEALKGLNCHLVYTVPISLVYSNRAAELQDIYADVPQILPMVMVHNPHNKPYDRGLNKVKELLQKRINLIEINISIMDMFQSSNDLEELCLMSGGHIRNLILLMKEAIKYADKLPIPTMSVKRAISEVRNTYQNTAYANEWEILGKVHLSKAIENDQEHRGLLFNRCILQYRYLDEDGKAKSWYDVHPIMWDIEILRETVTRLT
ncbi:ATP-binding protein [Calothrix sp. FACHB-156]|nr:ATP-binding protein [Calothrix sp. FACHB-156]